MVRVTVLPSAASVLPVIVGVVSLVLSGAETVIVGAVASIEPVSLAVPVLPAVSVTLGDNGGALLFLEVGLVPGRGRLRLDARHVHGHARERRREGLCQRHRRIQHRGYTQGDRESDGRLGRGPADRRHRRQQAGGQQRQ